MILETTLGRLEEMRNLLDSVIREFEALKKTDKGKESRESKEEVSSGDFNLKEEQAKLYGYSSTVEEARVRANKTLMERGGR